VVGSHSRYRSRQGPRNRVLTLAPGAGHAAATMITLDLLRHGEARATAAGGDAARPLSLHGSQAIERLGRHLGTLHWQPGRAFTSPLLRAQQTAALVLLSARVAVTPEARPQLLPESAPPEVAAMLVQALAPEEHVLLVGHQPLLGDLVGWLIGQDAGAITPGQLMRLTFADGTITRGAGAFVLTLRPETIS
jgi:phosphohistidine phosphatase